MDPLVRQAALEALLDRFDGLNDREKQETLSLSLSDPDLQINEIVWNFVKKNPIGLNIRDELIDLANRFEAEGTDYFKGLAVEVRNYLQAESP